MQDFEKIYVDYLRDVYNFLLKLSGSEDIAEELTQSTFSIAFENLGKFRGTCKMSVWLCQIAKNLYIDDVRRKKRFETIKKGLAESPRAEEGNAESAAIRREEVISIYKAFHCLEEPYKEVFGLRTLGELSYREIGEIFEKSESWARVTYHRAKLKIREQMM